MGSVGPFFDLFVTSVEKERSFLRIWGQKDHASAKQVELLILQQHAVFENSRSVPAPTAVYIDLLCCARYKTDGSFYRARVLDVDLNKGSVSCLFIDYGNRENVPICELRLLDSQNVLLTIPAQATSFILSEVVGCWEPNLLTKVVDIIGYEIVKCMVVKTIGHRNDIHLLKLYHKSQDFSVLLASFGAALLPQDQFEVLVWNTLGVPASYSHMMTPNNYAMMNLFNQMGRSPMNMLPPHIGTTPNPIMTGMAMHPAGGPSVPVPVPVPVAHLGLSPPFGNVMKPPATSLKLADGSDGECRTIHKANQSLTSFSPIYLDDDSEHKVYIPFVDKGTFSFVVQLLANETELTKLSKALNNPTLSLSHLRHPYIPGTICVAKFTEDDTLYRAVITGVEAEKCIVYFVDFGNTDSVKCHDLYEIPSEFVYLKAMGIQFTLAGLTNVNCTDEMLQVFFDLVLEKEAVLKVVPPKCKELLAKQQAELFIDDTNVKELINLEILKKRPKTAKFSYRNVALPEAGSKVKVVVSYVKSLDNFYVQLSSQQNELDSMMATVQSHCSGPAKSMELVDIQPGAICCALFENDGQWYRGLITSAESDEINVLYVDYGNEELVKLENLKHPDENIVNKLRTQAVPCRLSDIENCSGELLYKFEDFVLEKPLMMHVISFNKEVPCVVVRLFDEHGQDICKQLLNKPVVSTPRYESSQSENIRAVRDSKVETSSTRSGNSTNTGVNARQNSSSSDCTRQDESSSRDRSNNSYSKDKRDVSSYGDKENDASYRGRRDDSSTNRDCKEGDAYKRSWEKDTHNHSKNHLQGHGTSQRSLSTSSVGHCDQTSEKHYQSRDRRGESRNGPCGKDSFEARASRSNIAVPKADSEDVWDDSPKTPSIQCMSVVIGIKKPISIVYSNNPSDFYVQERPTSASFDTLMEDMEIYRNGGEPLPASNRSVGNACVAMYDLDGSYYRANILEVCGGRAKVMFVDYGNMEMVELDNLRKIDAGLLAVAGQAIHCKLMGVPDSSWSDDKVAQFALLCDSESLEAEFVEVKNSVHYIILRDVATNVTINEGYGATPESLLSPRSIVNTVQPCPELQCGSQHVAKVCWFETPGRFYVQLKSAEDEFRRTMKNLQSDYKDKTPLSNPVIGQCVVAIFKSDGAFYRARIKVQKDSRYGLQFIDYGNRSLVEPVHIYGLEHQYSSLPAQAILCSLDGVQPLEGGNWAKNPDVAKCFDGELVCNVVQETKSDEASYVVRLSCNGQDLSEILISKGFASDVTPVPASVEVVEDYPEVTPGVDLQILEGQIVPAHLTPCSSFGDELRVHVSFEEKELLQLKQNMEKLTSEELVNLPSEMVRLGQKCIVFTQASEYKRAFIVNGKSTAGVCIKFMDQGGFEECPCDKIYILPSNLELVPPMAHEFAPRNINCEKDLEHLCGKKVVVSIESYHSDKQLLVGELLYSCDNALVSSLNQTSKQEARILMAMPILKRRLVVTIAHASGSNVWLHEVGQQEILSQLLDDIYELYENDGEPLTAVVGALCAAKSHDDSWYRAIIEEVSSEGALVRYVDYGNTETLPFSNLKELNNFREIPALAVQASLPIIADETLGDEVLNLAGDKEFLAVFAKQGGKWLVELLDGENEMSVKLIQSRKAQPIEMNPLPALVARVLDVGSRSPAVLSFVTSPSEFYIHLRCHSKKLDKLQADLQTLSHCMSSFEAFPDEGTKVMALFSEDGVWYRGQVMPNQVIHFIDFGNESVAQLCDLKFLPPEMALIPSLATKCSLVTPVNKRWSENASDKLSLYLDGGFVITVLSVCGETFVVSVINSDGAVVPDLLSQDGLVEDELDGGDHAQVIVTSVHTPGDFWVCFKNARQSLMHCALYLPSLFSDWSSAATCFFKDMVADGATVFEMVTLLPGDPTVVSLTVNGRNIDEEVIALCSPKTWQKATVDATVVFANSPGDFYIHLGRDTDAVDEMNNNLQKAEEFGPCSSSSGTICAALYDEDKLWYRAIILGENSSSYNVRFLDYGNVGICSELKALPPHLQKIPPLALHCCLPLPDGTTEWSSAACEKFLEMLESRFELELLSSEEPFIVNMVCDSLNVAHEMASLSGVEVCHVDNLIDALRNSMLTVPSPKGKNLIRNGLEETSTPAYEEPSELHSSIVEITANSTGVELSTDGLQVEGEDNFEQTGTVLPNILCENREILLDSDATVGAEKLSVNTVVRDSSTVTDIAPISGQESVMLSETASLDNSVRLVEDGTEMLTNLVNNCLESEMISEGTDITEIMETEMPGNFRRNFTPEPSEVTESVKSIAPVLANSKLEDSIVDITPDVEIPVITLDDTLDEASSSGFQGLENSISSTQSSDTYCRAVAVDSKSPVVCGPNDFSSEIDPSNVCTENEARTMSVVSNAAPVDLIGRLESYNDVDCQVTSSEISSSSGLLCVNFASPDRDLSTIEEDEKEFVECLVRRSPDLLCGTCETSRSSAGNAVNEKAENASSGMETDILPDVTECKDNLTSDGHEVNSEVIVSLTAYPDERSCDLNVLGISHGLSVATTSDFNSELPDIHSVLQIGVPGSKLYIFDDCEEHSGNVIDVQTSC